MITSLKRCTGSWEILARGEGKLGEVPVEGWKMSWIFTALKIWKKSSGQGLNFYPPTGTSPTISTSPNWQFPQLAFFTIFLSIFTCCRGNWNDGNRKKSNRNYEKHWGCVHKCPPSILSSFDSTKFCEANRQPPCYWNQKEKNLLVS